MIRLSNQFDPPNAIPSTFSASGGSGCCSCSCSCCVVTTLCVSGVSARMMYQLETKQPATTGYNAFKVLVGLCFPLVTLIGLMLLIFQLESFLLLMVVYLPVMWGFIGNLKDKTRFFAISITLMIAYIVVSILEIVVWFGLLS